MNKVIISGNLCKEVELKYTGNNVAVLSNSVAVRNEFKNANGEYESQFINFVAYRNNAEFLSKYTSKGNKVLLEGRLNTRSYDDKDGNKKYITEVIVDKVELLGTKKQENAQNNQNIVQNIEIDPFEQMGMEVDIDDYLD